MSLVIGWKEIVTQQDEKDVPIPLKDHAATVDEGLEVWNRVTV